MQDAPLPTVLTVLLNWRTAEMTLRAAESALRALEGIAGALVIVDNDSGDGSFERLSAEVVQRGWDKGPQQVRVMQSGRNGGFGAGNNFGLRLGLPGGRRPDFVYVQNSDTFPAPDAIAALLRHLRAHPENGAAGSRVIDDDGVAQQTAFRFPSIASEFEGAARFGPISRLLRRRIVALPLPAADQRVDWLAGASVMLRVSAVEQVGLFDEAFFLYFEETELFRRLSRAGFACDYIVGSEVVHIGSVSTGMKTWRRIPGFWFDSRLYYFTKVHGPAYAAAATLAHLTGGMIWRLRCLVQGGGRDDPPHFLRDLARHYVANARRVAKLAAQSKETPLRWSE